MAHNAVGIEITNASELSVLGNLVTGNRVGVTVNSNDQEALAPQHGGVLAGNVITDNNAADTPEQADGGYGIGIGIGGGVDNQIIHNRIEHNPRAGVLLANTEDLPATGNRFEGNRFAANGVDLANIPPSRAPAADTCLQPLATTLPKALAAQLSRGCAGKASKISLAAIDGDRLPSVSVPDGANFHRSSPRGARCRSGGSSKGSAGWPTLSRALLGMSSVISTAS